MENRGLPNQQDERSVAQYAPQTPQHNSTAPEPVSRAPAILATQADFHRLLRWVQDRFDAEGKVVTDMFRGLIAAVGKGDRYEFEPHRSDVLELVLNVEAGLVKL